MAVDLTIAGTTFEYPTSGEDPNWSEQASGWAIAVTEAINTLLSPGDILQTTFTLSNNIAVPTNINGLLFDSGMTRAANVSYVIYRISDSNTSGFTETGTLLLMFDDSASPGTKWQMSQVTEGNSGISFFIGDDGQMKYISSDLGDIGYAGTIRFAAKTLAKV